MRRVNIHALPSSCQESGAVCNAAAPAKQRVKRDNRTPKPHLLEPVRVTGMGEAAYSWPTFLLIQSPTSSEAEECAYLRLCEKMTSAYHGRHG
ncbi:unnamed protein product [Boreogadus saida]